MSPWRLGGAFRSKLIQYMQIVYSVIHRAALYCIPFSNLSGRKRSFMTDLRGVANPEEDSDELSLSVPNLISEQITDWFLLFKEPSVVPAPEAGMAVSVAFWIVVPFTTLPQTRHASSTSKTKTTARTQHSRIAQRLWQEESVVGKYTKYEIQSAYFKETAKQKQGLESEVYIDDDGLLGNSLRTTMLPFGNVDDGHLPNLVQTESFEF
ncbi:hypothetical protein B0H11DRAFT_1937368 [Mycena galericulata]|nr:hypothetical protein B0H11DRAFT_1937368 [Mycena galericulata]